MQLNTFELKSIKEDIRSWKSVSVSSWVKIYTWNDSLELEYRIDENDNKKKIKIEPHSHIEAKEDIIILSVKWDWFINTWVLKTFSWDDISKMKWMPLLFWTKLEFIWEKQILKENSYVDIAFYENSELRLDFNKVKSWELYDLWEYSEEYLFSVNKENEYFYAKMNWFKNNIIWNSTRQLLLAPQLKSDKSEPEFLLNTIKVPVYQEVEIDITDKILEDSGLNWIEKIYIDYFLDIDRNGDLDTKNDDDSMPNLNIFKRENKIFLKAWKFTSLVDKDIWINIIDKNWNNWFKKVKFQVYSPIPEIEAYDWVKIYWKISESLKDEPINFYRFRWGNLAKLWDEKWAKIVYTNEKWEFELKSWQFKWGLAIKDNLWNEIANISEKTWKISINQKNKLIYNIDVWIQENTNYPQIFIKNNSWKNIFSQILKVIWNQKVWVTNNFENIDNSNWVYLKFTNNFNYWHYILPENIWNNPWVFVWFRENDINKTPLFKIYPDWRLEIPDNFKINYKEFKNYIVLNISENWKNIFEILYKIDADYVIN